jgi:hypothetical protein
MESSKESSGIDKQGLWGWWHEHQKWSDRLHRKAAHKALDIEDDAMISVQKSGMGWKELAVVAVGMLGGTVVGANYFAGEPATPAVTQPPAVQSPAPALPDTEYEVRFYDAAGNRIDVPRWPGNPASTE